jgi:hypothetical protein
MRVANHHFEEDFPGLTLKDNVRIGSDLLGDASSDQQGIRYLAAMVYFKFRCTELRPCATVIFTS